mmetsp:Transcript_31779/g.74371  ORF Transcript_31779/g.74371 Transcript_31779/m.74371 type:complete len:296 (-) Transcript_31779:24-911(-)
MRDEQINNIRLLPIDPSLNAATSLEAMLDDTSLSSTVTATQSSSLCQYQYHQHYAPPTSPQTPLVNRHCKPKQRVQFAPAETTVYHEGNPLPLHTTADEQISSSTTWLQEEDYRSFRKKATLDARAIIQLGCCHQEPPGMAPTDWLSYLYMGCLQVEEDDEQESSEQQQMHDDQSCCEMLVLTRPEMTELESCYADPCPEPTPVREQYREYSLTAAEATPCILGLERFVCHSIANDRLDRRRLLAEFILDVQSYGWLSWEVRASKLYQASTEITVASRVFARHLGLALAASMVDA